MPKQPTLFTNQTILLAEWESLLQILYQHPGQFKKWLKGYTVKRPRAVWRCTGCGSDFTTTASHASHCVYCGAVPVDGDCLKLNSWGTMVKLFPLVVEQLHLERYWVIEQRKPKFVKV